VIFDGDGINDSVDFIVGNISSVMTNLNLSVEVNQSFNLSQIFSGLQSVLISDDGVGLIEFELNLSSIVLNLTDLIVRELISNNLTKFFVSGLDLGINNTKIVFFTLQNESGSLANSLCIKDDVVFNFSDISSNCSGANEIYISSIPYFASGLNVTYENQTTGLVRVSGLTHSGIAQMCSEDWNYTSWTTCSSSSQSRTAEDLNVCGTTFDRLALTQSCVEVGADDGDDSSSGGSDSSDDDDDSLDKGEQWFSIEIDHDFDGDEVECDLVIDGDDTIMILMRIHRIVYLELWKF